MTVTRKTNKAAYARISEMTQPQPRLKVGWFANSMYPERDGAPAVPVAEVAAKNEFGGLNVPARPFMRPTMFEKEDAWKENIGAMLHRVARGEMSVSVMLEALGLVAVGDIKKKINEIWEPPLSDATVAARARRSGIDFEAAKGMPQMTKPLEDTGHLLATLTHIVEHQE